MAMVVLADQPIHPEDAYKYVKDDDGEPLTRPCEICGRKFYVQRRCADKTTCSKRCTLTKNYGGPGRDYELAKKTVAKIQAEKYKAKTGYSNPGQNPEVRKKVRQTLADHYGGGDYEKATEVLYEKQKQGLLAKTGYSNPGQNPETKEKVRRTVHERYGVDNVFQSEEVKEKIRQTTLERYGVTNDLFLPAVRAKGVKYCMEKYGVPYMVLTPAVMSRGGMVSHLNKTWHNRILRELGVDFDYEVRFNADFDPDADSKPAAKWMQADLGHDGLLLDFNPTISHNSDLGYLCLRGQCRGKDTGDHSNCKQPKSKTYHQDRAIAAMENGCRLLQFYDWNDPANVLDAIKSNLDETERTAVDDPQVKSIDASEANEFLAANTVCNRPPAGSYCLGLFSGGELAAVLTAVEDGAVDGSWVIDGLATKSAYPPCDCSKTLFDQFVSRTSPKTTIMLVSLDAGDCRIAEELGFELIGVTEPTCHWSRVHSHGITEDVIQRIDETAAEAAEMQANDYARVYDSGCLVWSKSAGRTAEQGEQGFKNGPVYKTPGRLAGIGRH